AGDVDAGDAAAGGVHGQREPGPHTDLEDAMIRGQPHHLDGAAPPRMQDRVEQDVVDTGIRGVDPLDAFHGHTSIRIAKFLRRRNDAVPHYIDPPGGGPYTATVSPLKVAILWYQHQPLYRSTRTGRYA